MLILMSGTAFGDKDDVLTNETCLSPTNSSFSADHSKTVLLLENSINVQDEPQIQIVYQ